jgi:hypothetical protein
MAWKPGQSGNPGGRPKELREIAQLSREHSKEAIERLVFWMRSDNPKASTAACNAILDRGYGKPSQPLEHDVGGGLAELLAAVDGRTRGIPKGG